MTTALCLVTDTISDPCQEERSALRRLVGVDRRDTLRVTVVAGASAPTLTGESYYHTTLSGKTRVEYPGAYRWPTWYHASTRRVVVGRDWLAAWRRAGGCYGVTDLAAA